MDTEHSPAAAQSPTCHRCNRPMVFDSQETVQGKAVNLFRCDHCNILEAIQAATGL